MLGYRSTSLGWVPFQLEKPINVPLCQSSQIQRKLKPKPSPVPWRADALGVPAAGVHVRGAALIRGFFAAAGSSIRRPVVRAAAAGRATAATAAAGTTPLLSAPAGAVEESEPCAVLWALGAAAAALPLPAPFPRAGCFDATAAAAAALGGGRTGPSAVGCARPKLGGGGGGGGGIKVAFRAWGRGRVAEALAAGSPPPRTSHGLSFGITLMSAGRGAGVRAGGVRPSNECRLAMEGLTTQDFEWEGFFGGEPMVKRLGVLL